MARATKIYLVLPVWPKGQEIREILGAFTVKWEAIAFAMDMAEAIDQVLEIISFSDGRYLDNDVRKAHTTVWRSDDGE